MNKIDPLLIFLITFVVIIILVVVISILVYKKRKQTHAIIDTSKYKYDIYVINLARRRDRMVKFAANYDLGMPYKILDAVDGKSLNLDNLYKEGKVGSACVESIQRVEQGKGRKHHYEIGSIGAVGCTLSHLNAWNKAQLSQNNLIVFEDDAVVSGMQIDELDRQIKSLPPDWHIYIIGKPHTIYTGLSVDDNLIKVQRFCALHAYVVSQKGIEFLLKKGKILPINQQLDSHLSELNIDHGLNMYATKKGYMFLCGDTTTDIQVSNQGHPIDDGRLKI